MRVLCYDCFMPSPEAHPQEQPLSAEQQEIWRALVKEKALRPLQAMEALYLSEEEQEKRKIFPLTNERYQEWLSWMKKIDADPKALFRQHMFVDEGALAEKSKAFMDAMEALEELRVTKHLSEGTKQKLDMERLEYNRFIFVPDVEATELTAIAKQELDLTYITPDSEPWDYYQGNDGKPISGRGKVFEVMTWKPGRDVSSDEVREHFEKEGFYGHAGAFTQWRRTCGLSGYHASIPDNNGCWRRSDGRLHAPCSYFGSGERSLNQGWVDYPWRGGFWSFVAFREV